MNVFFLIYNIKVLLFRIVFKMNEIVKMKLLKEKKRIAENQM